MSRTTTSPRDVLDQMAPAAGERYGSAARWAKAAGLPRETLSRLRNQASCDLRTLGALAEKAGGRIVFASRAASAPEAHMPEKLDRQTEERLLDLAASGNTDPARWRGQGPAFFMGGLAVMLGGARGFEREPYLRLAEALHPGVSTPEVFGMGLERTPVRPARFLPMARKRREHPG